MRAFEIYLNGKKLCVAGMGDQGQLLFCVSSGQNLKGRGTINLGMTGMSLNQETVRWRQRDARKYEKAWVRRMAKEFGWTIEKKARKT